MLAEDLRLPKSCVADRAFVLLPGVRPMPLRWESLVQGIRPLETSRFHVYKKEKALPEISISTLTHSSTQRPEATVLDTLCQTTSKTGTRPHPLAERMPKIIIRSQTPENTPPDVVLSTRKTRSSLIHQNTGTNPLHQKIYTTH